MQADIKRGLTLPRENLNHHFVFDGVFIAIFFSIFRATLNSLVYTISDWLLKIIVAMAISNKQQVTSGEYRLQHMATIKFGEEPTSSEQRSAFCQLKDGAKIPGYRGFCPEYQFSFGKTFAEATRRKELQGCGSKSHHHNDLHSYEEITVPENNGFNRYTTGMVSGYTGYIPKRAQQFGRTYTEECTNCFKEHFRGMEKNKKEERQVLLNGGKFQPLRSEDDIAEHMKRFFYNQLMDKDFSRGVSTMAPISGYTGHIPKKDRTEIGLGTGFDLAASKSLDSFNLETKYYKDKVDFYGNDRICCCRHFRKQ